MTAPHVAESRRARLRQMNLASPAFKDDPFAFCAEMRAHEPVLQVRLPTRERVWLVARYDDVVTVFRDDRFSKDPRVAMTEEQQAKQPWSPRFLQPFTQSMQSADGARHARLRGLVQKAFTPRMLEAMPQHAERVAHRLLDRVQAKGQMDLVRDFAMPLPLTMICEMLGIPSRQRPRFHRYVHSLFSTPDGPAFLRVIPNLARLYFWVRDMRSLLVERRSHPRDDLISTLVEAEEAGDRLDPDESLAMLTLLISAGFETTANLISGSAMSLLRNPEQLELLRRDTDGHIKPAIEEFLRYITPADASTLWYAREDISMAGVTIPRGEMVSGLLISANFDDSRFDDPMALDITRRPNKHLAFGVGRHHCLGAAMARIECQVALEVLLERCPDLRLANPQAPLQWRRALGFRGLDSLPVLFSNRG